MEELNAKIQKDHRENSTLPKIVKTPRPEVNAVDVKIQKAKGKKQVKDVAGKNNKEKDMQSKDKEEEKIQKINPSNPPRNIGTTSENHISTKLSKGLGMKSVDNSVKATATMKNKSGNPTRVELRKDDEYFTSTKNGTSDSLQMLKTHPADKTPQSALTQHMKVMSPHPVERHLRHRIIKDRDSIRLYSSVIEMMPPSQSDPSQDLGKSFNTFDPRDSKVFKRLTSDFANAGSISKMYLKVNIKPSDTKLTEETGKVSLKEHKEGFPVNLECGKLQPVQTEESLPNSTCDSCGNATKPTVLSVAKPAKTTKKALPSNPWPSKAISNSGQARTKKRTTACVLIERFPFDSAALPTGSIQTDKATKESTHVPRNAPEDLLKDKEQTESSKHQQDSRNPFNTNDTPSCLKVCLLTSAAENQSETSHFKRDYKKCSQFYSIHQRTTKKSKQNAISIPSKTQKVNTLEMLVKQNGTGLFESICQTTDADPGMASSVDRKPEALSNSSKSIPAQKTRISTNEKNKKTILETANKAKTSLTLTAVRENRAAIQKSNKNELSSSSLYSTAYHHPLSSTTTTPTIFAGVSTTISTSGHLTQESGLYPGPQSPRQALRNVLPPPENVLPSFQLKTLNNHLRNLEIVFSCVSTDRCIAV